MANCTSYLFARSGMLQWIVQLKAVCEEGSQWIASTQCPHVGQGDYPWNCLPDHMRAKVNEAAINNHLGKREKRHNIYRKKTSQHHLIYITFLCVCDTRITCKKIKQTVVLTSHFFVLHLIGTKKGPVDDWNWISPSKSSFSWEGLNIQYVASSCIWLSRRILNDPCTQRMVSIWISMCLLNLNS